MPIEADKASPAPGDLIELFTLDASAIGGATLRFTPGPKDGAAVEFQNAGYSPLPIEMSGLNKSADGAAARPRLIVSAVNETTVLLLTQVQNLRGATVTRLRTFAKYLDGEPGASPDSHLPIETFRIERLAGRTPKQMEWTLASHLDFDQKKIPSRQVLREVCGWEYRRFDGADFDYTTVQCPYTADAYFDANDNPVDNPAADKCSRRLSGCRARYGSNDLPFGAFAGVGRLGG